MRTLVLLFALTLSCLAQPLSPHDPAFLQSTSPLRRGLVGYWRLEEASGTRYDCSSSGNHLTANNTPGSAAGVVGNSVTFVAASLQSLSIPSNSSLQVTKTNFTVAVWCKAAVTNAYQRVISKLGAVGHYEFALQLRNPPGVWGGIISTNGTDIDPIQATTFGAVPLNVWCFIVFIYNTSTPSVSMSVNNGALDVVTLGSYAHVDSSLFEIGAYSQPPGFYSDISVDEAGVWNRVLSAAEITQLYNSGLGTHFPWAHP